MTTLFGTDGIRAKVGSEKMNPQFVLKLAIATGSAIRKRCAKPMVVIGRDTRQSGKMLEAALQAGFTAMGVDVLLLGIMPTPGIAYLTRTFHADLGIVISASHNPYDDNGIKFFSSHGTKISDELEAEIEYILSQNITPKNIRIGECKTISDASSRYIEFCKSVIPHFSTLHHLKMVVDCSNGATYNIAPDIFKELGATVVCMGNHPNGININKDCGSTSPQKLQASVIEHHADIGVAFDGDGDRVILVDSNGCLVDGDQILYILAMEAKRNGHLKHKGVVGTHMSNLGLENALLQENIPFERTQVGDRYVMQMLHKKQWLIGGESSGHIIWLSSHTTGDGIVATLQVLNVMQTQGTSLTELLHHYETVPQVLINIAMPEHFSDAHWNQMLKKATEVDHQMGKTGRVLLRKSGTEPLIRIMVEAKDLQTATQNAEKLKECFMQTQRIQSL